MEMFEKEEPLPKRKSGRKTTLTCGLIYNLKKGIKSEVEDIEAEYDSIETVNAIKKVLEDSGCNVLPMEADSSIFNILTNSKPDIVFNIAEGMNGRGREAQIPTILRYYGIPFTGSDETTLCIALDKALTKRILSTYKIRTPKYQLVSEESFSLDRRLDFPLIVKPNAEGSSKGISSASVVHDMSTLKEIISRSIRLYAQPVLIEEFVGGREFTVALCGNGKDVRVFAPMEIIYKKNNGRNIYSYEVKKNYKQHVDYVCPAELDAKTYNEIISCSKKIHNVLQCKDFSRIDFRLSESGQVHFLEINPLPGLAPGYSDFPMITGFNGLDYSQTVLMVLNSALKRHGMKTVTTSELSAVSPADPKSSGPGKNRH